MHHLIFIIISVIRKFIITLITLLDIFSSIVLVIPIIIITTWFSIVPNIIVTRNVWQTSISNVKLGVYNDKDAILCDLCNQWSYRIWIKMTKNKNKKLEKDTFPWLYHICQKEIPFQNLTSKELKNILISSKISLATQNTYIKSA